MRAAVFRYRVMAYVTGVVLIVLCFVGIPLQVLADNDVVAHDVGTAHGILYIIYLITAYLMSRQLGMKLASAPTVILLLAGTIPVLTFVVERWTTRRFINPALAAAARGMLRRRAVAAEPDLLDPERCCGPDDRSEIERLADRVEQEREPGPGEPPPPTGHLLDLGCGYGPLALVLAARSPGATVWAVDVNERALGLCAGNAQRAGLPNVRCAGPGDPALPARFGLIWSNPPIRIGKAALHELLAGWLARLAPGGTACLVVQRNLGADSLQRWLAEAGWPARRLAARGGYRVLAAGP